MKTITTRTRLALVAGTLALAAVAGAVPAKFYSDDPIARIVDSQDASGVRPGDRPHLRHAREPVLLARIGRPTSGRRTSTRSMKCRTRTGSRTGWAIRHGRRTRQRSGVRHRTGAGQLDGDFGQERRRDAGVHVRLRRPGLVHQVRSAGYPAMATGTESSSRGSSGASGITSPKSIWPPCRRSADDRRAGAHHAAEWKEACPQDVGRPLALQGAPRGGRIMPCGRQQGAPGPRHRRIRFGHAVRRSERRHPARAPARARGYARSPPG